MKAGKILEELGLEEERIEEIQGLIAATDPEKEPENLPEEIIQDSEAVSWPVRTTLRNLSACGESSRPRESSTELWRISSRILSPTSTSSTIGRPQENFSIRKGGRT